MLQQLLESLEAPKREVYMLYELEELPMPEVARVLEIPVQTAYSRYHAACREVLEAAKAHAGVSR